MTRSIDSTESLGEEERAKLYYDMTNGYMSCGSVMGPGMSWDKVSPKCPVCGCLDATRVPPYYSGIFKCERCGHEWFNPAYAYLGT